MAKPKKVYHKHEEEKITPEVKPAEEAKEETE